MCISSPKAMNDGPKSRLSIFSRRRRRTTGRTCVIVYRSERERERKRERERERERGGVREKDI